MLTPGDTVAERYVVEQLIGSGGLAHVYRVRHVELGSAHALKVLAWDTPALAKRMLREGRIQAQLNHPNIVRVTDVLRDGAMVGLLMDYVPGATLEQHLRAAGPLSVDACLRLMAPVLSAVARAHDVKVLHRDLKPANVLLEQRGSVLIPQVTDFGIAKALSDSGEAGSTRPNAVLGTPGFMAPEQFLDAGQVTPAVDVFSLAVMIQTALTADVVFPEPTGDVPLVERLLRRPVPLPDHLPQGLRATLAQALATEPADRFPDARAFANALLAEHPDLLAIVGPAHAGAPLDPVAFTATPAAARRAEVPNPTILPLMDGESPPPARGRRWPLVVAPMLLAGAMVTAFWWSRPDLTALPDGIGEPVTDVAPPQLPPVPAAVVDAPTPADDASLQDGAGEAEADTDATVAVPATVQATEVVREPVVEPTQPIARVSAPPEVADTPSDGDADLPQTDVDTGAVAELEADTDAPSVALAAPQPQPQRIMSVVAVAPEEPEPEERRVDVAGRWVGTADGRPLVLELEQGIDGTASGQVAFTLGTTQRTFRVIGTVTGERVELDADGAFRFTGVLRNGDLGGTYTARSRGRAFPWTTRRD